MRGRIKRGGEGEREAMRERLRYFVFKARRDPKSLTLAELDELCRIVAILAPPPPRETDDV